MSAIVRVENFILGSKNHLQDSAYHPALQRAFLSEQHGQRCTPRLLGASRDMAFDFLAVRQGGKERPRIWNDVIHFILEIMSNQFLLSLLGSVV